MRAADTVALNSDFISSSGYSVVRWAHKNHGEGTLVYYDGHLLLSETNRVTGGSDIQFYRTPGDRTTEIAVCKFSLPGQKEVNGLSIEVAGGRERLVYTGFSPPPADAKEAKQFIDAPRAKLVIGLMEAARKVIFNEASGCEFLSVDALPIQPIAAVGTKTSDAANRSAMSWSPQMMLALR